MAGTHKARVPMSEQIRFIFEVIVFSFSSNKFYSMFKLSVYPDSKTANPPLDK